MAQPTVEQVWKDPDFQGLPMEEKRKVLTSIDTDFAGLPSGEQDKVLGYHTVTQPSGLEKLSSAIQDKGKPLFDAMSKITSSMPIAGALLNPMEGAAFAVNNQVNNLTGELGNATSEALGKTETMRNHPYVNAGLGMAASVLANPSTYAGKVIPSMNVPLVNKSQIGDIPLTRAAATGSPAAAHLENFLANTPTGAGVIEDMRNATREGIGSTMDTAQSKYGTSNPQHITGDAIREHLLKSQAENDTLSNVLYDKVPKDTQVPLGGLTRLYSQLSDVLPDSLKKIVNKYVQTEPITPTDPNPGAFHGVADNLGKPNVAYDVGPDSFNPLQKAPILDDVRQLRSLLTAAQQEGGTTGRFATLLKQAVNHDLNTFATSDNSPVGSLVNQDAVKSLNQATNFYREKMALENHPLTQKLANRPISDLPDLIFKPGRVEDVQVAKSALGDVGYAAAQRSFFTDLLHAKDIAKEVSKFDPEFLKQALTSDQLNALRSVDSLKKVALGPQNKAAMTGSTRMNYILGMLGTAGGEAMAGHPIAGAVTAASGLGLPYLAAKGYQAVSNGINASVGPATTVPVAQIAARSQPRTPLDVLRAAIRRGAGH